MSVHLFGEADYFVMFCDNHKCLKICSDHTKSIERKIYNRKIETKSDGIPLTGAEKFRMGSAYKDATLSKWVGNKNHSEAITSWFRDSKPFLVIMAISGSGKTYLCAAILNYLFERKVEIEYITHRRFTDELKAAIAEEKPHKSIFDRYAQINFLIFDDIGSAQNTEWQQEMILELIDRRYSDQKKTVITSNFFKNEMYEKLGNRTASRMFDKNNLVIEMHNGDRRILPDEAW